MVIAVIDSGFNPIHETMRLDSGVDVALSEKDMTEKSKSGLRSLFSTKKKSLFIITMPRATIT